MTRPSRHQLILLSVLFVFVFSSTGCRFVRGALHLPVRASKGMVDTYKKGLEGYD